jgi:hypothetical protein
MRKKELNKEQVKDCAKELQLVSKKVDDVINEMMVLRGFVEQRFQEVEHKLIERTTIVITNGDNTPKEIVDRNKFFSDLYNRTRYSFFFQSVYKSLGTILTILLILNLVLTILSRIK